MSKKVTLYTMSNCGHCVQAHAFLTELLGPDGFTMVRTDMLLGEDRNDAMRRLRQVTHEPVFPIIFVGDDEVIGFKKDKIKALLDVE